MSTVLVTGANGFVGSHMVPALVDAGHRVLALVRDEEGAVQVTRRLAPAERDFVHLGALGVVDDPDLHYGSSKVRAMDLVRKSGLDWTILSPSLLFGPRDGFFNILADLVRMSPGIVPITGKGDARFQPLAIGDLAHAVVLTLGDDATVGREYQLGGPRYWTYREIVEEVLRGMGRKRALVPMPVALIRLVAGVSEKVRLPFPVATDQLRQLKHDNIGPVDSVRSGFGFDPQPMEGGLTHLRQKLKDQEPASADQEPASA
jgi:uncharacterized protein YbjT (DUF2867 family)